MPPGDSIELAEVLPQGGFTVVKGGFPYPSPPVVIPLNKKALIY
jgi:hypothetical protein